MICANGNVDVGTAPTIEATIRDIDNSLVNPTSITVTTRSPSDNDTTYTDASAEVTNPSVGVWRFTFPAAITEHGKWWVRWDTAGANVVAEETSLNVIPARVPV